ncbi:hypothetical protein MMC07_003510 [Pseudocyphellaria aurata]|nr:hypothetical protein [Pseudocyphellaria aurata]
MNRSYGCAAHDREIGGEGSIIVDHHGGITSVRSFPCVYVHTGSGRTGAIGLGLLSYYLIRLIHLYRDGDGRLDPQFLVPLVIVDLPWAMLETAYAGTMLGSTFTCVHFNLSPTLIRRFDLIGMVWCIPVIITAALSYPDFCHRSGGWKSCREGKLTTVGPIVLIPVHIVLAKFALFFPRRQMWSDNQLNSVAQERREVARRLARTWTLETNRPDPPSTPVIDLENPPSPPGPSGTDPGGSPPRREMYLE